MSGTGDYQVMITHSDGHVVVHVVGEIDLQTETTLTGTLSEAAASGRRVVVDLSRVTFIDSTGLKALLEAWRSQAAAGRELVLRNPSGPALRTLEYAGLADTLTIDRQRSSR